jgi:hypothetical protein
LVRDPAFAWPANAPRPNPNAATGTLEASINNVFLGASGWCVLHEVAHIRLKHQGANSPDRMLQQEFEADDCPSNTAYG